MKIHCTPHFKKWVYFVGSLPNRGKPSYSNTLLKGYHSHCFFKCFLNTNQDSPRFGQTPRASAVCSGVSGSIFFLAHSSFLMRLFLGAPFTGLLLSIHVFWGVRGIGNCHSFKKRTHWPHFTKKLNSPNRDAAPGTFGGCF